MAEYQAIETEYNGYRFRSRLEARWAVFFDACGIKWEYEPEGFTLPSGENYLPDFRLYYFCGRGPEPNNDNAILWAEVKGVVDYDDLIARKKNDVKKVEEFCGEYFYFPENPIIILPNIPKDSFEWWQSLVTTFDYVDGDCAWPCIITKHNVSNKQFVLCGPDGDSCPYSSEINFTNECLSKARSAHFEFSEKDLKPLENEVEMLRKRKELMDEKDQLLKQIRGGF